MEDPHNQGSRDFWLAKRHIRDYPKMTIEQRKAMRRVFNARLRALRNLFKARARGRVPRLDDPEEFARELGIIHRWFERRRYEILGSLDDERLEYLKNRQKE